MSTFLSFQLTIEMEPKVYVKKGKSQFPFFYCTCYQKKQKEFGKRRADSSGTKPLPKHNKAFYKLKKYFQIFLHIGKHIVYVCKIPKNTLHTCDKLTVFSVPYNVSFGFGIRYFTSKLNFFVLSDFHPTSRWMTHDLDGGRRHWKNTSNKL